MREIEMILRNVGSLFYWKQILNISPQKYEGFNYNFSPSILTQS
jgi:hypothetical protein